MYVFKKQPKNQYSLHYFMWKQLCVHLQKLVSGCAEWKVRHGCTVAEGQAWQSRSEEKICSLKISNIYAGYIYIAYISDILTLKSLNTSTQWFQH